MENINNSLTQETPTQPIENPITPEPIATSSFQQPINPQLPPLPPQPQPSTIKLTDNYSGLNPSISIEKTPEKIPKILIVILIILLIVIGGVLYFYLTRNKIKNGVNFNAKEELVKNIDKGINQKINYNVGKITSSIENSNSSKYLLINNKGEILKELDYGKIISANKESNVFRFEKNGLMGLIDKNGNEVLELKYRYIGEFKDGLAVVSTNVSPQKYGYIDEKGKEIITPKYDEAEDFSSGFGKVKNNNKYGFVDNTGKEIFSAKYQSAADFSGQASTAIVDFFNTPPVILNKNGKEYPYPADIDSLDGKFFSDGIIVTYFNDNTTGFVDSEGKVALKTKYMKNTQNDLKNEIISITKFYEGLALVEPESGGCIYIDKNGKEVITLNKEYSCGGGWSNFSNGYANIWKGEVHYILDKKGKMTLVPLDYEYIKAFNSFGIAEVGKNKEEGAIDYKGNEIVNPKYRTLSYLKDLFLVSDTTNKYGLLDGKGKEILSIKYTDIVIATNQLFFIKK